MQPLVTKLHLQKEHGLDIAFEDGLSAFIPIRLLRARCPCASCKEAKETQKKSRLAVLSGDVPDRIVAVSAEMTGNYAIRISWSDGHASGIYSFEHLRTVARETANSSVTK